MARLSKDERDRISAVEACKELTALLSPLVGFPLHLEAIAGPFLKPGAAMSLASAQAAIETLRKTTTTAARNSSTGRKPE
jgi:hypothetical protein